MYRPTLFPPTCLDARIVVATPEPTPCDTSEVDAPYDDAVVFAKPGLGRRPLREVAPPTGEFVEYLFAEHCDEEITDWAHGHLEQVAQIRVEVYRRLIDHLDITTYPYRAVDLASVSKRTLEAEVSRMVHDDLHRAACAAIYTAVAHRART